MAHHVTSSGCIFIALLVGIHSTAELYAQPLPTHRNVNRKLLSAARQARLRLEKTDAQFVGASQELETALERAIERVPDSLSPSDLTYEREALFQLDRMMEALLVSSEPVIQAQEEYLELGKKYREELLAAGPLFTDAADQCRGFAAEESFSDFRDDYLRMADILDRMAIRCESIPSDLSTQVHGIEELFPYLQSGRQLLVRFRAVLSIIPTLQSEQEILALDQRLKAYAQSFEGFRGSLQKLHERLQSSPPDDSASANLTATESSTASAKVAHLSGNLRFASRRWAPLRAAASNTSRGEDVVLTSLDDRRSAVRPIRHILVFVLPGTAEVRHDEITGKVPVQPGVAITVATEGMGTFTGIVKRKLYSKNYGKTQYWSAKIDPSPNSR